MTVVYSAECKALQKANRPAAMLPILIILFIFSYAILTLLVFEQGQTIESQRCLLREMLKDSTQLAALKGKLARDGTLQAHGRISVAPGPSASTSQGKDSAPSKNSRKQAKRPGKSARSLKQAPGKPPSDLEDVRRSTRAI